MRSGLDAFAREVFVGYNHQDPMHELGIMSSAMDAVLQQARTRGAHRVHRIVLRIGTLAGVEPESLRFAFDVVTRDTIAEGSELQVDAVTARAYCAACAAEFDAGSDYVFSCPTCGQLSGDLRSGRELDLAQIEMS
jgi:hydrogenase nickel incorporation protein HypA/HybF